MTLQQIKSRLVKTIGPDDSIRFWAINTRLFLKTGVDLKNIKPEQSSSVETIQSVRLALSELGYHL